MTGVSHKVEARQGTGGPRPAGGDRGRLDPADLEARIGALEVLATADLRIEWRKLHRTEPPTRLSRDLLIRAIAYKLQEQTLGGLSPATTRRLHSLAGAPGNGGAALMPVPALKPGTRLVREWHGRAHTVIVLDDGFDYTGERYRSLTQIAKKITGSHRSGPIFFGLNRRPSRASVEAGDE